MSKTYKGELIKPSAREGGLREPSDAGCPSLPASTHTQTYIHRVPKEAEASGLFPHVGPCQGPGRGPGHVLTQFCVFVKSAKIF